MYAIFSEIDRTAESYLDKLLSLVFMLTGIIVCQRQTQGDACSHRRRRPMAYGLAIRRDLTIPGHSDISSAFILAINPHHCLGDDICHQRKMT